MAGAGNDAAVYSSQEQEVADIKKEFPGCKVIKDVGDFKYVVDIKSDSMEFSIKFQIEGL